ncbi:hypothetical protein HK096_008695, partial [Nowakowskiella sp. JEL0078]
VLDKLKAKGADIVACIAANDAFVMDAWGKSQGVLGKIEMFSDGLAVWSETLGLALDLSAIGFGKRTKRYAIVLDDLYVKYIGVDTKGVDLSGAAAVLAADWV